MDNFMYINTIRKPNGELRSWDEHNYISEYERACDRYVYNASMHYTMIKEGKALKDEERGRVQKSVQKFREKAQWLLDQSRSSDATGDTGPVRGDARVHTSTSRGKVPRRSKKRKI